MEVREYVSFFDKLLARLTEKRQEPRVQKIKKSKKKKVQVSSRLMQGVKQGSKWVNENEKPKLEMEEQKVGIMSLVCI